jgi:hypothetical protein
MNVREFESGLQLLADGEMGSFERADFLRGLPVYSDRWRLVALAFVERQILDESLGYAERTVATRQSRGRVSGISVESAAPECLPRSSMARSAAGSRPAVVWRRSAVVSAVAICLAIGFIGGQWSASRSQGERAAAARTDEARSAGAADRGPVTADSTIDVGERPLPLADALARSAQPISWAFRREMMKRGYLISEEDRWSKVELPTGQLVEFPVRQVAVRYLGLAAYQ